MASGVIPPSFENAIPQTSTNSPYLIQRELRKLQDLFRAAGVSVKHFMVLLEAGNVHEVATILLDMQKRKDAERDTDFADKVEEADDTNNALMLEMIKALYRSLAKIYAHVKETRGEEAANDLFANGTLLKAMMYLSATFPELSWPALAQRLAQSTSASPSLELVIGGVTVQIHHEKTQRNGRDVVQIKDVEVNGHMASNYMANASSADRAAFVRHILSHLQHHHLALGEKVHIEFHPDSRFWNDAVAANNPQPTAPMATPFNTWGPTAKRQRDDQDLGFQPQKPFDTELTKKG